MIRICSAGLALVLLSGCATAPMPKTMPAHHRAQVAHRQALPIQEEPAPTPIAAPVPAPAPPVRHWRWFH